MIISGGENVSSIEVRTMPEPGEPSGTVCQGQVGSVIVRQRIVNMVTAN
jgi:hypothetical protein